MQVQEELVVSKDQTQIIKGKGKRAKRQRLPTPLRVAMPSTSCSDNCEGLDMVTTTTTTSPNTTIELRDRTEEEDMANCLILLAQGHDNKHNKLGQYLYQCKTCNRCFPSFQALGGHRTSHKKPKTNGTNHYDPITSTILSLQIPNRAMYNNNTITTTTTTTTATKSKIHECSICGVEFSSGQALGGHMRRHRSFVNTSTTTSMSGGNIGGGGSSDSQEAKKPRNVLKLDLNLPAPEDADHRESKFTFLPRENVIVFSTSSLVDCHY
ncbi:zinc finger protein ZAT5-like [Gastrolobium bilobum]|uniref:zinc finger protein ZAT5-like n=1 Tax=Gastrolobium bilobum TaxID=150636 RepID=UPI002AB05F6A|nr:zinc finger protein ZAT5-like [Gastrolobium bilobum]